ncbi:hypothetical protein GGX14DRAFT_443586 [Mycena pura]|uniref:Uncharacterized protein n=1 Tax=Mycena pura TaxID=153505 RepID=A0AAD6VJM9_9AGAR|nr:hypothetical protein GGX14DRAFT_443586 [Mycena pura]
MAFPVGVDTCMSLPISCVVGPQSQSFEEVRIADYLSSYRATGRPPPPVPQLPADPAARAAQGLPPLFLPAPFPADNTIDPRNRAIFAALQGGGAAASTSAAAITRPELLPSAQALPAPVSIPGSGSERELFVSIAVARDYAHFSHEELRYYAYARGARAPPMGTPPFAFGSSPLSAAASSSAPTPETDGETLVSITTRPEFAGHSVEELRVSFLSTGAELTSAQIFAGVASVPHASASPPNPLSPHSQRSVLSPFAPPQQQAAPSLFGRPGPLSSQPQAQPTPTSVFGAPQAQAPALFSFGASAQPPQQQQQQPQQQQSISFGGALPHQAQSTSLTFGAPPQPQQQQPASFSFGGALVPHQPGGMLPGAPAAPMQQQPQQAFSFGMSQPQPSAFGRRTF